ncbi:hypothetical protein GWK47_025209 [Chionoecetes opilio]|uniref:Uncharacterized protein n=1 Tax=Chionoecetes opilio TaxID=41210 RepID=A0A8J4XKI1_CHIOP|nr:hypothetical protein GWK47_025209 [Chionoecetes opilio]
MSGLTRPPPSCPPLTTAGCAPPGDYCAPVIITLSPVAGAARGAQTTPPEDHAGAPRWAPACFLPVKPVHHPRGCGSTRDGQGPGRRGTAVLLPDGSVDPDVAEQVPRFSPKGGAELLAALTTAFPLQTDCGPSSTPSKKPPHRREATVVNKPTPDGGAGPPQQPHPKDNVTHPTILGSLQSLVAQGGFGSMDPHPVGAPGNEAADAAAQASRQRPSVPCTFPQPTAAQAHERARSTLRHQHTEARPGRGRGLVPLSPRYPHGRPPAKNPGRWGQKLQRCVWDPREGLQEGLRGAKCHPARCTPVSTGHYLLSCPATPPPEARPPPPAAQPAGGGLLSGGLVGLMWDGPGPKGSYNPRRGFAKPLKEKH